jgi:FecR protein
MSCIPFRRLLLPSLISILLSLPAVADSHVRIVRLSSVVGTVTVDRGTGKYEKAMINLPITQGMKLRSGYDGRAEVEFEDGTTVRLVADTAVQFPQLVLKDSGTKLSEVEVTRGTAYIESSGNKTDQMTVQFGRERVAFNAGVHARIGVDQTGASFAVFKGDLDVEGPSGDVLVKKGQTGDFDFSNNSAKVAKKIQSLPDDDWDKDQDQYHQQYARNSYDKYSPYQYGTADLAYYGNFFNAPGYGMLWQPYFVGMGWDPFMQGAWAFSPGFGYGWISAYPWGWTPYHYGTWVFLPTSGWAWQPGGTWMPMYTQMAVLNAPKGFVAPQAPTGGTGTMIVNRGPGAMLAANSGKLVIRNNSAGLGIPRGQFESLGRLSQRAEKSGVVATMPPAPAAGLGVSPTLMRGSERPGLGTPETHEMAPAPSAMSSTSHAAEGSGRK